MTQAMRLLRVKLPWLAVASKVAKVSARAVARMSGGRTGREEGREITCGGSHSQPAAAHQCDIEIVISGEQTPQLLPAPPGWAPSTAMQRCNPPSPPSPRPAARLWAPGRRESPAAPGHPQPASTLEAQCARRADPPTCPAGQATNRQAATGRRQRRRVNTGACSTAQPTRSPQPAARSRQPAYHSHQPAPAHSPPSQS